MSVPAGEDRGADDVSRSDPSDPDEPEFEDEPAGAVLFDLRPRPALVVWGAANLAGVAGLSALATYRAVAKLGYDDFGVEVKVLPHGGRPKKLVVPPAELIHDFQVAERVSKAGTE